MLKMDEMGLRGWGMVYSFIHWALPTVCAVLGMENISVSKIDSRSHRILGEALLAEGMASAKALRQKHSCHVPGTARRPAWLESRGKKGEMSRKGMSSDLSKCGRPLKGSGFFFEVLLSRGGAGTRVVALVVWEWISCQMLKSRLTVVVDGFHMGIEGKRSQGWYPKRGALQVPKPCGGKGFPRRGQVCTFRGGEPGRAVPQAQGRKGQCRGEVMGGWQNWDCSCSWPWSCF